MDFQQLISIKKNGDSLSTDQLNSAVRAYGADEVPEYQMAALLMAICWQGLSTAETSALTSAMVASGDRFDWCDLPGPKVDKHSTGGVGDKVSLALAPLAAACGCLVPMVSGRGLGYTGGTLDKLESIPGMSTDLDAATFRRLLGELGVAMGAQTDSLVPADRRLYALRDVTCTVAEPGLITASILSKKLAEGAEALVMDIKVGSGAFQRDLEEATVLADRLVSVANQQGLAVTVLLTDMNQPLGRTVGNALEVAEAIEVLRGDGPARLRALVLALTAEMLLLGDLVDDRESALSAATATLDSGLALQRLASLIEAQGGDPRVTEHRRRLPQATAQRQLRATAGGTVARIDARKVAEAALAVGAGRRTLDDEIDPAAGVTLHVQQGDVVEADMAWATLHHAIGTDSGPAAASLQNALELAAAAPPPSPVVLERRA